MCRKPAKKRKEKINKRQCVGGKKKKKKKEKKKVEQRGRAHVQLHMGIFVQK